MRTLEQMIESWPEQDRKLWLAACVSPECDLDEEGLAADWRPSTTELRVTSYHRWIQWLRSSGFWQEHQWPHERLTKEAAAAYVEFLRSRYADWAVSLYLHHLCYMVRAMCPGEQPRWLAKYAYRLGKRAKYARPKAPRIVHSRLLYRFGLELMRDAMSRERLTRDLAVQYRDGLMIAMLAAWPLRRGEFFALQIGHNFKQEGNRYIARLDRDVTKSKRERLAFYPTTLTRWVRKYLEHIRPNLTRDSPAEGWFWLRHGGKRMLTDANRIARLTFRKFGKRVNPHLFRDCAATTVALDDPRHSAIIPHVLGHASAGPGKIYNQANMISAGRKHREVVLEIGEPT